MLLRNTLDMAKQYLANGLSIVPVPVGEKHPIIPWKEYQTRLPTEQEIQTWFSQPSNIAVITGQLSDLLVIEADAQEGLLSASKMGISSCVSVLSGNGRHFWFRYLQGVRNSQSKIAPNLDIRGEGGLAIIPPSVHANGMMYRFLQHQNYGKRPIIPPDLVAILKKTQEIPQYEENSGRYAKLLDNLSEGNRHTTFLSVLGSLRRNGYSQVDARRFLASDAKRVNGDEILDEMLIKVWENYPSVTFPTSEASVSIKSPTNREDVLAYEEKKRYPIVQIRTGFPKLDTLCVGGLKSERLFTVAARTGTGKTNFAINLSRSLCENGKTVLYFSTEFSYTKVWDWFKESMSDPAAFTRCDFRVCDSFAPSLERVEDAVKRVMPDVWVFDHANHIAEDVRPLGEFMQGCNLIQRKYGCQGIMIAQLNRSADWVENGERIEPRMSMIKGSGTIEQASSRVLLLSERRRNPECIEIQGILDKNDSGSKGVMTFGLYTNPWMLKELS